MKFLSTEHLICMKACSVVAVLLAVLRSNVKSAEMCKKAYIRFIGHVIPIDADDRRVPCETACQNDMDFIQLYVFPAMGSTFCMDRVKGPSCATLILARALLTEDELSVFQRTIEDLQRQYTSDPRTAYGLPVTYPSSARPINFFRCMSCGLLKYKQKTAKIGNFRTLADKDPSRCLCEFIIEYPQVTVSENTSRRPCSDASFLACHQIGRGWQVSWVEIRAESSTTTDADGYFNRNAVASTSTPSLPQPDFTIYQHMIEPFDCDFTIPTTEQKCRWPLHRRIMGIQDVDVQLQQQAGEPEML